MLFNDHLIGVISMQSHEENAYSPDQISMFEMLGTQAAIAIQNSQLFENIQHEKKLTDTLVDSIPEFFFLVDQQGQLVRWNKASEALWKFKHGEINYIDPEILVVKQDQKRVAEFFDNVFATGQMKMETQLLLDDGRTLPVFLIGTRITVGGNNYLIGIGIDISEQKKYEENIESSYKKLHEAFRGAIDLLAHASELRDPYTAGHQERVSKLAVAIAVDMGLDADTIEGIQIAGIVHDIGKMSIPTEILSKPSKLSELEFSLIKTHVDNGFAILKDIEFPWPIAEIVYQHHERLDGTGYPRRLKEPDILIGSKILAVADVIEAMSSHRPYRPALGIEAALNEIKINKGRLYDSEVVEICLRLFLEKKYTL